VTTQPDPIRAEALGLDSATATFAGCEWRIPLDVDTWPLPLIQRCRGITAERRILIDHVAVVEALEELLGEQFGDFLAAAPRRGDLVPASNTFAAAAGMPAGRDTDVENKPIDRVFGALPRLLTVLARWPEAVESDLNRFWNLDYRDRWRFDDQGRRKLTLRQIYARIDHLPADSALAVQMGRRSPVELLLMDVYEPLAGRPHPARPLTPQQIAERHAEAEKLRKARSDYESRRTSRGERVAAGLDTARANAQRTRGTAP
jgi:hypothetical protein